ncbi:MAG: OmpA family protein [Paracoccus sp. (in: a-proteobacteria)]|uniref:OmpA family protein n=1 Tax=Paracoccus sp. TaxID=267 RepID=UPI00391905D3
MTTLRRRLTTSFATVLMLGGAGGLCWWGAQAAATFIETKSAEEVGRALQAAGHDWADVSTDGLLVRLTGVAPTEVDRFRATTQAATAVDASRIVDEMTVAALDAMTPPDFKVELLRNDQGISLIGLVPAATDRTALIRTLRSETAAPQVTDLLESADYPVPATWEAAMRFGLMAAQLSSNAKISVAPGQVHVAALADSRSEKARLEAVLRRSAPDGVTLTTEISAPRPVIAPFMTRFVIDGRGPRLDSCAADDDAARLRILNAAQAAGVQDMPDCTLGLGAPSPRWGEAAEAAIGALAQIGAGSVMLSDASVSLTAPAGVDRAAFDAAVAALEAALPRVFVLQATLEEGDQAASGPVEFSATLTEGGSLSMRGGIADARMREAVDSFARSRFQVAQSGLRSDDGVPGGWTVRVIAALEAMDALHSGHVSVTPDLISVNGISGQTDATGRAAAILAQRLGAGARYELAIRYDRHLDAALGLPDGEACVAGLNLILSESEIGFEPSRASIAGDPGPTLASLAEAMADCADYQIEAGGHTDSQGSEAFNADLSRSRAQAILAAMEGAGIDTTNMTARGYGESQPIASNETDEGREANRRIEFRLLSPRPVRSTPLPEPVTVAGVTGAPVDPVTGPEAVAEGPERPAGQGPVRPPEVSEQLGPPMPMVREGAGMSVQTLGASEEFQTLDEREENIRVPVLTPDENTPRPPFRPEAPQGPAEDEDTDA